MGRELGRISGPLLSANLLRDGVDLAFETSLLYLDVSGSGKVGIQQQDHSSKLNIGLVGVDPRTTRTTNLIVDTRFDLDNDFTILTNKIQYLGDTLIIQPNQSSNPTVTTTRIGTANLRISDKLVENITPDSNIELTPNGTGRTVFNTTKVNVNSLHATGDITWDGDIIIGDDDTDSVSFVAEIASDLIPDEDNTYDLGSDPTVFFPDSGTAGENGKEWGTINVTSLVVDSDYTTENVFVETITVGNDSNFKGNSFVGNSLVDDQVTFNSKISSSLVPSNSTYTIGTLTGPYVWDTVFLSELDVDATININNTTIQTLGFSILDGGEAAITGSLFDGGSAFDTGPEIVSGGDAAFAADVNLVLGADGTGRVYVPESDVDIPGNLTITGNTTVDGLTTINGVSITGTVTQTGNIDQTGDLYVTGDFNNNNIRILSPSYITVPDIKIEGNEISVTATDQDLQFFANGTGGVVFDRQIRITNSVIENMFDVNDINLAYNNLFLTEDGQLLLTESDDEYLADTESDQDLSIIFRPSGTGNIVITGTNAVTIPIGNTGNRPLDTVGEIRQNSTTNLYEGWTPNGLVSFNNLYDSDRNTYITPELTPGANDNTIRFGVAGTVLATIDSDKLFSNNMYVDNVRVSGSTINNLNSSTALNIVPDGAGSVIINSMPFKDNSITNTTEDALVLANTGTGYVKFTGTHAVVFPSGTSDDRRLLPETGEYRYNTELEYSEIYTGDKWIPVRGEAVAATEEEIVAETNFWAFILG